MFINLIALALVLVQTNTYYCFSQCATSVNGSCNGSPYACIALDTAFLIVNALNTGYTKLQMSNALAITTSANFKMSQTFTPFVCTVTYAGPIVYNYNVLGKFVNTDYIYKRYTVTQPHYQITVRLSIAFMGVWSGNDYLSLYTFDGTTERNFPMRYSCTDPTVNYTETICSKTGNNVDCILSYNFNFPHNSSYLLVNFTSLTNEKDVNVQYWSLFDLNIYTVDCNSACAACYTSNAATTCTACTASNYLTGNSCGTCAVGTYQLANSNPLLGGYCVASCPQSYYISSTACLPCASGCLTCNSSTICTLTTNVESKYDLWQDKMAVWIIIILVGVFLIIAIIYRLFCQKAKQINEQQQRIISELNETKHADEKLTAQQRESPRQNDKNVHIEQIDFNDHVMIDVNPRRRKRQERDLNRSNINIQF